MEEKKDLNLTQKSLLFKMIDMMDLLFWLSPTKTCGFTDLLLKSAAAFTSLRAAWFQLLTTDIFLYRKICSFPSAVCRLILISQNRASASSSFCGSFMLYKVFFFFLFYFNKNGRSGISVEVGSRGFTAQSLWKMLTALGIAGREREAAVHRLGYAAK